MMHKSAITTVNASSQPTLATGSVLTLLGSTTVDTGNALSARASSIRVNSAGLYYIGADVTVIAGDAGSMIIQLYNNTIPVPTAITTMTTTANTVYTVHVETFIQASCCPMFHPEISVNVSGIAGTVTHVTAYAIKEDVA